MRMVLEQCELCRGLRGHERIKHSMHAEFNLEYERARREVCQLSALFRDVCWYNFETCCRVWNNPWFESLGDSHIILHGHCYKTAGYRETGSFPIWYSGNLRDAPRLPPEILFNELIAANDYMQFMNEQRFAPFDFAPGGRKYEQLLREGVGVMHYKSMYTERQSSNANCM